MKKRFLCLVAFLLGAIGASAQTAALAKKQVGSASWRLCSTAGKAG